MLATIIIIGTALVILACLYLGPLLIELDELSRRAQQLEAPMDNDEYDYGHNVNYKEEEE